MIASIFPHGVHWRWLCSHIFRPSLHHVFSVSSNYDCAPGLLSTLLDREDKPHFHTRPNNCKMLSTLQYVLAMLVACCTGCGITLGTFQILDKMAKRAIGSRGVQIGSHMPGESTVMFLSYKCQCGSRAETALCDGSERCVRQD